MNILILSLSIVINITHPYHHITGSSITSDVCVSWYVFACELLGVAGLEVGVGVVTELDVGCFFAYGLEMG